MTGYKPKHMAYSPKNETAFRVGLALSLTTALLWASPALAAESASGQTADGQSTSSESVQSSADQAAAASNTAQSASDAGSSSSGASSSSMGETAGGASGQAQTEETSTASASTASSDASSATEATTTEQAAAGASDTADAASGSASGQESGVVSDQGSDAASASEAKEAASDDGSSSTSAAAESQDATAASASSDAQASAAEEASSDATATKSAVASVQAAATAAEASGTETSEDASVETTLDGYEIAASQSDLDVSEVAGDFVIIKATEGNVLTTSYYQEKAEEALEAGKLLGFYHFARTGSTAEGQAEYFVDAIKNYIGKAVLFLDWENTSYSDIRSEGTGWCKTWLDTVYQLTGVKPLIYLNKYATTEYDFSNIASDYKLWVAQYADTDTHEGYQDDPWTSSSGYGAWAAPTLFQYSSTTRLSGFSGNLDVDKFYGSKSDWAALAASESSSAGAKSSTMTGDDATAAGNTDAGKTETQVVYANLADGLYEIQSVLAPDMDIEIRDGNTSNGGAIQTWTSNSTVSQRWKIIKNSDGTYSFMNVKSGKYLDVPGAEAVSQRVLQEYDGNGTDAQHWFILDHDGKYEIVSALDRSLAVDVTGANTASGATIQLYTRNNTAAQRFTFKQILQEIEDAVYTIANKASNKSVDVSEASIESRANVQQYTTNGTVAQEFQVAYDEATGYYTIRNVNSGRVLDVAGGSYSSGNCTNVWQYSSNGTDAQKWAVTKNADGTFTFTSALNGRALDLSNGSRDSGANIWIYDPNGTDAQKWVLGKVVDWLQDGTYQIVSEVNHDNAMMSYESSVQSGTPIYMRVKESGNTAQGWYLTKAADGYVTFTNVSSGLVLDLQSAIAANGTSIQQYTSNGTDAQLWKVVIADNGYKLVSKVNPSYVIDVPGATDESFTKLQSYVDNGTSAQRWHLIAFSPLAAATNYEILAHVSNVISALEGTSTTSYGSGVAGSSSSATEFQFVDAGNSSYRIRLSDGTYLAAHSDSTVHADAYDGSDAQTWRLEFNDAKGGFTLVSNLTNTALNVDGTSLTLSGDAQTTFSFHKQQTKVDQVINTAAEEIRKYGDNGSKYWDYYFGGGWINWYTTPYCACFVSWVLHEDGVSCAGMPSASTQLIRNGARRLGRLVSPREAQRGDIVLYDWDWDGELDHTGIVESNRGDAGITTIEGNTSVGDEEGIVASRNRSWKYVAAIVRPYY